MSFVPAAPARLGRLSLAVALGIATVTVHIYGARTTTALRGLVEVVEDPEHPWGIGVCGAVVMGDCIEP